MAKYGLLKRLSLIPKLHFFFSFLLFFLSFSVYFKGSCTQFTAPSLRSYFNTPLHTHTHTHLLSKLLSSCSGGLTSEVKIKPAFTSHFEIPAAGLERRILDEAALSALLLSGTAVLQAERRANKQPPVPPANPRSYAWTTSNVQAP